MAEDSHEAAAPKPKKRLPKTAILIGAITVLQAVGFFVAMKFFGSSPAPTYASGEPAASDAHDDESGDGHGESAAGHGDDKKDAGHGAKPPAAHDGGHGEPKKAAGHGEPKKDAGHGEPKKDSGHGAAESGHGGKNYADTSSTPATEAEFAEVTVLAKFRAPNHKSGRTYVYDFEVRAIVAAPRKDDMERLVKDRAGEIADRVAQTIRAADEKILREDDLQTLRMQLRNVLTQIAGDEKLIRKVLIPKFVPMRAD